MEPRTSASKDPKAILKKLKNEIELLKDTQAKLKIENEELKKNNENSKVEISELDHNINQAKSTLNELIARYQSLKSHGEEEKHFNPVNSHITTEGYDKETIEVI